MMEELRIFNKEMSRQNRKIVLIMDHARVTMRSSDPSIDIFRDTLTSESLFPERAIRLSEIFLMCLFRDAEQHGYCLKF